MTKFCSRVRRCLLGILLLAGNLLPPAAVSAVDQFPAVVEAEQRAVIAAEREGVLVQLPVDVGDRVPKGELLGVVYHEDLVLEKKQLQANQEYLEILSENLSKLNQRGLATDEEFAKAEMDLKVNTTEIERVQTNIERSRMVSPFTGFVVVRHAQRYEWVKPGQPVVEMYDPRDLRIVTDIPFDIAVGLSEGREQTIFFPGIQKEVTAQLAIAAPQVDVRSNTVKLFWEVPAADRSVLQPGMKGMIRFGNE